MHDVISSGGSPLDTDTRTDMESRMGADFSDVRVHHDTAAHESAKGVGAHAYTVGNNVVFQRDAYDPSSPQGRTTLAHELTHVIQQRNGPVEGTEAPGGIRVSDPSDRFEQEAVANADRVLAEPAPETASPAPAPVTGSAPVSAVQRTGAEDEDEQPADVQGSFVQRAAGEKPRRKRRKRLRRDLWDRPGHGGTASGMVGPPRARWAARARVTAVGPVSRRSGACHGGRVRWLSPSRPGASFRPGTSRSRTARGPGRPPACRSGGSRWSS